MRKLSADVFDQIKNMKGTGDMSFANERERENIRQMI